MWYAGAMWQDTVWYDASKFQPLVGQIVVCFYKAHNSYWTGRWHPKIGCDAWFDLTSYALPTKVERP